MLAVFAPASAMVAVVWITGSSWLLSVGWAALGALLAGVATVLVAEMKATSSELGGRLRPRFVEYLDRTISRRLSTFTRRYLSHMKATTSHIDLKGMSTRGDFTLTLDEGFVSTPLGSTPVASLAANLVNYDPAERRAAQTVWHWLDEVEGNAEALAIIGPPGSGKTTLLRYIAYSLSGSARRKRFYKRRPIPILLFLRDHRTSFESEPPSLVELIRATLTEVDGIEPPRWIEDKLTRGQAIVLFDGIDEMADIEARARFASWLDRQCRRYPATTFVATSRRLGYISNPLSVARVLQISSLSTRQIDEFIDRWYESTMRRSYGPSSPTAAHLAAVRGATSLKASIRESAAIDALATNPLLLTMIAHVHHYGGALPGTRAELYKEVCEVLLGKRHIAHGVPVDMLASQKQVILQRLAYDMMCRKVRDQSQAEIGGSISAVLARVNATVDVEQFIANVEASSGMLVEREAGRFAFAHLTFQEYLCAMYVRDNDLAEQLSNRVSDTWWHEVIRLFAASSDATSVIATCLERRDEPLSLALAIDCVREAREVGPEVRRRLNRVIDPANLTTDRRAREVAGSALLLIRVRSMQRLTREIHVSAEPVSNLEYWVYVDETKGKRRPFKWTSSGPRSGSEREPVIGIQPVDAGAFVDWLTRRLADGWEYRLLHASDLEKMERDNVDSLQLVRNVLQSGDRPIKWTWLSSVGQGGDSRSFRLDPQAFVKGAIRLNSSEGRANDLPWDILAETLRADSAEYDSLRLRRTSTQLRRRSWLRRPSQPSPNVVDPFRSQTRHWIEDICSQGKGEIEERHLADDPVSIATCFKNVERLRVLSEKIVSEDSYAVRRVLGRADSDSDRLDELAKLAPIGSFLASLQVELEYINEVMPLISTEPLRDELALSFRLARLNSLVISAGCNEVLSWPDYVENPSIFGEKTAHRDKIILTTEKEPRALVADGCTRNLYRDICSAC